LYDYILREKQKKEEYSKYRNHIVIHIQDIEGNKKSNRDLYDIIPEIQIKDS
jgi:hypothetical protein